MSTIDKINYFLAKQGKNGAGLCAYLGVSKGVYSQWNTGRTSPRKNKLPLIAEYLGVSVEELAPDEDIKKEPSTPASEELGKNDAVWNLRDEVIQQFPDFNLDKLNAVMDFVEARIAPEIAGAGREKAVASAFSRMTDDEFDAFLDFLNTLRAR